MEISIWSCRDYQSSEQEKNQQTKASDNFFYFLSSVRQKKEKKHHRNHPLIEIKIVLQLLFAKETKTKEKIGLGFLSTNWTSYLKCFITSESITLWRRFLLYFSDKSLQKCFLHSPSLKSGEHLESWEWLGIRASSKKLGSNLLVNHSVIRALKVVDGSFH